MLPATGLTRQNTRIQASADEERNAVRLGTASGHGDSNREMEEILSIVNLHVSTQETENYII